MASFLGGLAERVIVNQITGAITVCRYIDGIAQNVPGTKPIRDMVLDRILGPEDATDYTPISQWRP